MSRKECYNDNPECPYYGECYSDLHHTMWPSPDYTTPIENKFRELPQHKVQTCRWEHDQIHEGEPPTKPPVEFMEEAILMSGIHLSRRIRKALKGDGKS